MEQRIQLVSSGSSITHYLTLLQAASKAVDAINEAGADVSDLPQVIVQLSSIAMGQRQRQQLVYQALTTITYLGSHINPSLKRAASTAFEELLTCKAESQEELIESTVIVRDPLALRENATPMRDLCSDPEQLQRFQRVRLGSSSSVLQSLGLVKFLGRDSCAPAGECFLVCDQSGQLFVLKRCYDVWDKAARSGIYAVSTLLTGLLTLGISLCWERRCYGSDAELALQASERGNGTKILRIFRVISNVHSHSCLPATDIYTLSEYFKGQPLAASWDLTSNWNSLIITLMHTFQTMADQGYFYAATDLSGILFCAQTADVRICDVLSFTKRINQKRAAELYLAMFEFFQKLIYLSPISKRELLISRLRRVFDKIELVQRFAVAFDFGWERDHILSRDLSLLSTDDHDFNFSLLAKESEPFLAESALRDILGRLSEDLLVVIPKAEALEENLAGVEFAFQDAVNALSAEAPLAIDGYRTALAKASANLERCWKELKELQDEERSRLQKLIHSPNYQREKELSEASIEQLRCNLKDAQDHYRIIEQTEVTVLKTPGQEIIRQFNEIIETARQAAGRFGVQPSISNEE